MKNERNLTFDFLSGFWNTNGKDPENGIRLAIHYKILNPENIWIFNCVVYITDNSKGNKVVKEFTYNPQICTYLDSENTLMFNFSEPCYFVKWIDQETIIFGFKNSLNINEDWFENFYLENRILTK